MGAHIEYNARNQLTVWGPTGQIMDYATKQWSGLIADYCQARWEFFSKWLVNLLNNKSSWNGKDFGAAIKNTTELPFSHQTKVYPTKPSGDSVTMAQQLFTKYKPQINYHYFSSIYRTSQRLRRVEASEDKIDWISKKYLGQSQDF